MEQKKYGRLTKELMLKELRDLFEANEHFIIVGSERLSAQDVEGLRRLLRQEAARYVIVKNSLCQRILKDKFNERFVALIQGHTAIVFSKADPTALTKQLIQFAKDHQTFRVSWGLIAGQEMDLATIRALASLPSRQVLVAKVVGGIKAPLSGLVLTLSGLLRQLVIALDGVRQKKS